MKSRAIIFLLGVLLCTARAGDFRIDWYTIDCGGGSGATADGRFGIKGIIGQPEAGLSQGGAFELSGGFWYPEAPPCEANPPAVMNVVCQANFLLVEFSEPMDPATAENPANYLINGTPVPGLTALLLPSETTAVLGVSGLLPGIAYTLSVANVADKCGNLLAPNPTTYSFSCGPCEIVPPMVLSVWSDCINTVQIVFSERILPESATTLAHYSLDPGDIIAVTQDSDVSATLTTTTLSVGTYRLLIRDVQDLCGNVIIPNPTERSFSCIGPGTPPPPPTSVPSSLSMGGTPYMSMDWNPPLSFVLQGVEELRYPPVPWSNVLTSAPPVLVPIMSNKNQFFRLKSYP